MNEQDGIFPPDEAGAALSDIEEALRVENGGYPLVRDAGETDMGDQRPPVEKFREWFNAVSAFDPAKDENGWHKA